MNGPSKVDDPSKVNGLSESGRSWVKVDSPSESERLIVTLTLIWNLRVICYPISNWEVTLNLIPKLPQPLFRSHLNPSSN